MDRPRIDTGLMTKVMDHIENLVVEYSLRDPQRSPSEYKNLACAGEWDQASWRRIGDCGTAMCFAGWTCELAGGTWVMPKDTRTEDRPDGATAHMLVAEPGDDPAYLWSFGDGPAFITIRNRARRLLGLTLPETDLLFGGGNDLSRLRRVVADLICEQRIRDARDRAGGE